nr:hypothetical protein [uncultured Sphingomonas sp.]
MQFLTILGPFALSLAIILFRFAERAAAIFIGLGLAGRGGINAGTNGFDWQCDDIDRRFSDGNAAGG